MNLSKVALIVILNLCLCFGDHQYEYGQRAYNDKDWAGGVFPLLDDAEKISRPCPIYDTNCIRKYFSNRANCKISYGPVPDPLYRAQSNFYYPSFNISVSQIGVSITGLNGVIQEFYVEEKTQQVVLQIRFTNVTVASRADIYRFHRNGKEDAVTRSSSFAISPSFSTTTIFRLADHLDLSKSESTAFADVPPIPILSPTAVAHPDPSVAAMFAQFAANPPTFTPEAFLTAAPFIAGYFIQHSICDYGLLLL